jgi:hypothetical protein
VHEIVYLEHSLITCGLWKPLFLPEKKRKRREKKTKKVS